MPAPERSPEYRLLKHEHWGAFDAASAEKNEILIQNYSGYLPPHMKLKKGEPIPTLRWTQRNLSRDTAPSGADMRPNPALDPTPAKGFQHHSYFALSGGGGPSASASAPPPPPSPLPTIVPPKRRWPEELAM